MRLGLSLFFFFFIGQCCIVAQNSQCATHSTKESIQHYLEVKKASYAKLRSNNFTYIPVKFHAVANAEGAGRIRFEKILDQLCALNSNFEPLGFRFYMKDGTVNNVDNNTIYSNPSSPAGTTKMIGEKSDEGKNAVNIFIVNEAGSGAGGSGTTLGYYDFNQDLIVLKKTAPSNGSQLGFVLGHEVGHFFSLLHTFNGWDFEAWDGTPVTSTTSPGGELNELADGSNCAEAGDMICDTPADYNLGLGWDGCRDYDGGCTDPTGATLDPDESNFMGYFIGCEDYLFSEEQKVIMENDYLSPRRSYLRVSFVPEDNEVDNVATLLAPEDNVTTTFYDDVELEWEPVEGAEKYFVELTQGIAKFYFITESTSLSLTDLKPDKNYRWKVKAYSAVSTCADFSESFAFKTSDVSTAVEDVLIDYDIILSPNPVVDGEINIQLDGGTVSGRNFEIFNMSGSRVYSSYHSGNRVKINGSSLSKGIYILKIKDDGKIAIRKIIINE